MVIATTLLTGFYLSRLNTTGTNSASPVESSTRLWAWQVTAIGVSALLIAGWPTRITGLPICLGFHKDRFTLSMLIGVSLLFVGLLELMFKEQIQIVVIIALAVALSSELFSAPNSAVIVLWSWLTYDDVKFPNALF